MTRLQAIKAAVNSYRRTVQAGDRGFLHLVRIYSGSAALALRMITTGKAKREKAALELLLAEYKRGL